MGEVKIAMWSGPRNISTALMRSFGNRPDTFVTDEPLYGHFLNKTGIQHPGREEIIQSQNTDWHEVTRWLCGEIPNNKTVWYQKHMAHHLTGNMDYEWMKSLANCFLIRHPKDVIVSFGKKFKLSSSDQLGYHQQKKIYDWICQITDDSPPVIDVQEIVNNPKDSLRTLCERLNIKFYDSMLSWEPGKKDTDGVWAKYWYKNVEQSSSFMPQSQNEKDIPEKWGSIYSECIEIYEYLLSRMKVNKVVN